MSRCMAGVAVMVPENDQQLLGVNYT
jgi:hypothetical protein